MKYLLVLILMVGCSDGFERGEDSDTEIQDSIIENSDNPVLLYIKNACETDSIKQEDWYVEYTYNYNVESPECEDLFIETFKLLTDSPLCPMSEKLEGDDLDTYYNFRDECWDLLD